MGLGPAVPPTWRARGRGPNCRPWHCPGGAGPGPGERAARSFQKLWLTVVSLGSLLPVYSLSFNPLPAAGRRVGLRPVGVLAAAAGCRCPPASQPSKVQRAQLWAARPNRVGCVASARARGIHAGQETSWESAGIGGLALLNLAHGTAAAGHRRTSRTL